MSETWWEDFSEQWREMYWQVFHHTLSEKLPQLRQLYDWDGFVLLLGCYCVNFKADRTNSSCGDAWPLMFPVLIFMQCTWPSHSITLSIKVESFFVPANGRTYLWFLLVTLCFWLCLGSFFVYLFLCNLIFSFNLHQAPSVVCLWYGLSQMGGVHDNQTYLVSLKLYKKRQKK